MNKTVKYALIFVAVLALLAGGIYFLKPKNADQTVRGDVNFAKHALGLYNVGVNQSVKNGAFRLAGVLIGDDVASSVVSLHDLDMTQTSPSATNEIVRFTGSTLHGYYPLDLDINTSLVLSTTNQTSITIIWGNP